MPVTTYTLSGDFSALVGEVSQLRATIHANGADDSWINETDLKVILGGALLAVNEAGVFTATLPTSTGTGLQYEVRVSYRDNATKTPKTWQSGWFNLTANGNLATLANDSSLRVNPSLGAQLADRIDGYVDHGNIYGGVTFSGPTGSHWFDATAPTTITLDGFQEGQVVTLICFSGAEDVTINDAGDTTLVDGTAWSAILARGAWIGGGGGGEPAVPDTTPPTNVTGLTATGGEGQVTFNWNAATDTESPVKYGYRVWLTSGGATGAYTTRTSVGPVTVTGLSAGNYTVQVYSFSNGGNTTPVSATATVTVNPFPGANAYDTFNRSGNLQGSTTEGGGLTWGSTGAGSLLWPGTAPISGGKVTGTGCGAVNIGHATATVEADYFLDNGRITLQLAGASDGSTAIVARLFPGGEGLKIFRDGGDQIGSTVTGIASSGRIAFSYNSTTGAITVTIDGVTKFTGTSTGLTGTYSGIDCALQSTVDNVTWSW